MTDNLSNKEVEVAKRYNISLEEARMRIEQSTIMNKGVSFGEVAASLAGQYKAPEVVGPLETDGPLIDMIAKLTERSVAEVHSDILKGKLHNYDETVKIARKALQIEDAKHFTRRDRTEELLSYGYPYEEVEKLASDLASGHKYTLCCRKCSSTWSSDSASVHICSGIERFDSGAQREEQHLAYDNIPFEVLDRVAAIAYVGKLRYGVDNWRKGIPTENLFNHAIEHIRKYKCHDANEDHLAKAVWNLLVIMYQDYKPKG